MVKYLYSCFTGGDSYMGPDNWMTDIYKTGNATEDINYYDALMIVKLAFGYQQNNPDTSKNTVAALIERRLSDLKLLKEAAINFKNIGVTWDNLNNFAKFVSDTKSWDRCYMLWHIVH